MPTFIDESGDTGPSTNLARVYFRLVAVWIQSHDQAEAIRKKIRGVRAQLGLREDYEFKFSKTWNYPDRRDAFFRAVMLEEFRFAFTSIDKTLPNWKNADKQAIHWAAATELAATLRPSYIMAHRTRLESGVSWPIKELVVVDDNEDKSFLATIKQQFAGLGMCCKPPLYLVGKVKFRSSHPEELMQLADMVCGAAGAKQDGNDTWYRIIADRDLDTPINRKRVETLTFPPVQMIDAQSSA
jgi:hypothetical protein